MFTTPVVYLAFDRLAPARKRERDADEGRVADPIPGAPS
jgi:multidrug efflux pump